jgi:hypothetical protein
MTSISVEKQMLIDAARAAGFKVTSKQIDRWRLEKLLPEPTRASRGRSAGVARVPSEDTVPQLLALCGLLKEMRSLDRAAFRLWIDGFDVPLPRVQVALKKMVSITPSRLIALTEEERETVIADAEVNMAEDRNAPKGVRQYARRGKLAPVVHSIVDIASGVDPTQWPSELFQDASRGFEEMSGLARGRTGSPELNVKPWIRNDSADVFAESVILSRDFESVIDASTPEQLDRARRVFRCIQPLQRLVQFTNSKLGHCFGLETIIAGFGAKHPDALLFQSLLIFSNAKPELETVVKTIEADSLKVLAQLDAGLANAPQPK